MSLYRPAVCLFIALLYICSGCSLERFQGSGEVLYTGIQHIKVEGNTQSDEATTAVAALEEGLSYAPNNAFFGSSSVRWPIPLYRPWLYLRHAESDTFLGRMLYRLGSKPVWIADVKPELRAKVGERILQESGFLSSTVRASILPHRGDSLKARVAYDVELGPLYTIDSVSYLNPMVLSSGDSLSHASLSKLRAGQAFTASSLEADRQAMSQALREEGYYFFRPDYIRYQADTLQRSGGVQLRTTLLQTADREQVLSQWRIGSIALRVLDADTVAQSIVQDTVRLSEGVTAYTTGRLPARAKVLNTRIRLRPDELYRQSLSELTYKSLASLGAFSSIETLYRPRTDQEQTDSTASGERVMDMILLVRRDKVWDISLEGGMRLKSTDYMGPVLRTAITRRNLFGGGETFTTAAYGSYEWQMGANTLSSSSGSIYSYMLGVEASLSFPTLLIPGKLNAYHPFPTTTSFKLNTEVLRRASYYSLRRLGASINYHFTPSAGRTHSITPLSLGYTSLSGQSAEFRQIMADNPSLALSFQNQLIPQMGWTFTWDRTIGRRDEHRLYWQSSISEAGNLTKAVLTIGGRPFGQTTNILGVPFAQFVRMTQELRYTHRIDRNQKVASRLILGAIYSYGNMRRAPYSEQFYVGGASSLRAFTVRSLGPGRWKPAEETLYTFMDHVGEFKLEANLEYRGRITGSLEGAIFLDAGNVWLLRSDASRPGAALGEVGGLKDFLNQIAVGTGAGLRYDMNYLVLRFDVGIGLHLPYATTRSGWYNIPKLSDAIGLHLSIGYPF